MHNNRTEHVSVAQLNEMKTGKPTVPRVHQTIEHDEQAAVIEWFRLAHKRRVIFSVPNGANLGGNKLQRIINFKRLAAEGLTQGVPDLFMPEPTVKYHGLFIEMKTSTGKLRVEQVNMISRLKLRGYYCVVAHSAGEAISAIKSYLRGDFEQEAATISPDQIEIPTETKQQSQEPTLEINPEKPAEKMEGWQPHHKVDSTGAALNGAIAERTGGQSLS